jgi:hypothetical protein
LVHRVLTACVEQSAAACIARCKQEYTIPNWSFSAGFSGNARRSSLASHARTNVNQQIIVDMDGAPLVRMGAAARFAYGKPEIQGILGEFPVQPDRGAVPHESTQ